MKNRIHLTPDQIPAVTKPMPVLKLSAPVVAPDEFIARIMHAVAPRASLEPLGGRGVRAAYDGKRLVALIHPNTRESKVFPSLEDLKPGQRLSERSKAVAAQLLHERSLFPEDGTEAFALPPASLFAARQSRGKQRTKPAEYLSYVRFQRRVNGIPVFGPGTRAMVGVAADGLPHAFAHRWQTAVAVRDKVAPYPASRIVKSIRRQLVCIPESANVEVDRVTVGYYDGGRSFLQPIYRFTARVVSRRKLRAVDRHILGYVSIGDGPESLPIFGKRQGKLPARPSGRGEKGRSVKRLPPNDPTVGRYIVRNDSDEWVTSANEFLDGLESAQDDGGAIPFSDSQYPLGIPGRIPRF